MMSALSWRGALVAATIVAAPGPGHGAATPRPSAPPIPLPPIQPPDVAETPLPPYQDRLDQLAELMGRLTFLRSLCATGDGAVWRDRMDALLQAEGNTPARRSRLAGSFNRGYAGYGLSYRTCTPAAEVAIARALAEGTRLAAAVTAQFGTP